MFPYGSRESVMAAALATDGRLDAYERQWGLDGADRVRGGRRLGAEGGRGDTAPALIEVRYRGGPV